MILFDIIALLLFFAGTVRIIAITLKWINSHLIGQNLLVRGVINIGVCIIFYLLLVVLMVGPMKVRSQLFDVLIWAYFFIVSSIGLYTICKDYYLYFRAKKRGIKSA